MKRKVAIRQTAKSEMPAHKRTDNGYVAMRWQKKSLKSPVRSVAERIVIHGRDVIYA